MYSVILGRVRVTTFAVEKQQLLDIPRVVCNLSYGGACKAHAPYLWPLQLCNRIFLHCLSEGMIFGGKEIVEHKICVQNFSAHFS